jgi:hypothetical protein
MEGNEIEKYLQALDEELEERTIQKPVRLAVVGGVYMVCLVGNRLSTKDIDVVPLSFPDTMNPDQDTRAFQTAIRAVARKHGLKQNWMNDVVASFAPNPDPQWLTVWREFPNLIVYTPDAEFILALKLLSGRDKDEEDITALCEQLQIETTEQAQALVDRYAERRWQEECRLAATLDILFG